MPEKKTLPKKITPDRLKDSILEIRYKSTLPFEVLLGLFFEALDDGYKYTNQPIQNNLPKDFFLGKELQLREITLNLGKHNIFYTDKYKIDLGPNKIIFNTLNEYTGWDNYFEFIKKTINQLHSTGKFLLFERVGVRYVSEYKDVLLKDIANFSFSFNKPDILSDNYIFRSEFDEQNLKIILNLQSNVKRINTRSSEEINSSIIDIDTILEKKVESLEDLLSNIEQVHEKQKGVFFGLLKEDFLKKLNPKY